MVHPLQSCKESGVMGDHQKGGAGRLSLGKQEVDDNAAGVGVEAGGRFVGRDDAGPA